MKKLIIAFGVIFALSIYGQTTPKSGSTSHPNYGGGKHTESHGGTYKGGTGSSHKGGTYKNAKTNNTYGTHKKK